MKTAARERSASDVGATSQVGGQAKPVDGLRDAGGQTLEETTSVVGHAAGTSHAGDGMLAAFGGFPLNGTFRGNVLGAPGLLAIQQ